MHRSPYYSVSVRVSNRIQSIVQVHYYSASTIYLKCRAVFIVMDVNGNYSVQFYEYSRVSVAIVAMDGHYSIVSDYANRLVLLVVDVENYLSVLSYLHYCVTGYVVDMDFYSNYYHFKDGLVLYVVDLFANYSVQVFGKYYTMLVVVVVGNLVSFIVHYYDEALSMLRDYHSFFYVDLLCGSSFFVMDVLCGHVTVLVFPTYRATIVVVFMLFYYSVQVYCECRVSLLVVFMEGFSAI